MGNKRHEVPPAMLDVAAAAMMALQGTDDGCIATQDLAEAALKAVDVVAMVERIAELEAELGNIADAKSENFDMSGDFVDWARSRARWTLRENPNRIKLKSGESAGGE